MTTAECQYFELSPERYCRANSDENIAGDENADYNAVNVQSVGTIADKPRKMTTKAFKPLRTQQPQGLRQSTPPRNRPTARALMTPERHSEVYDDTASLLSMSVYSEVSVESRTSDTSRISLLSKKSSTKKVLSSEELERQQVEQKKRELQKMMKQNKANSRKVCKPDAALGVGRHRRSTGATMPQEFSLTRSCPTTPRSPGCRSCYTDCDEADISMHSTDSQWNQSLRSDRSSVSGSNPARKTRGWRPTLTVPQGPNLATSRRPSVEGRRLSRSCPPDESFADECPSVRRSPFSKASTPHRTDRKSVV